MHYLRDLWQLEPEAPFFETFPQFTELKEEFKEVLEWKLETPNWWVDDE